MASDSAVEHNGIEHSSKAQISILQTPLPVRFKVECDRLVLQGPSNGATCGWDTGETHHMARVGGLHAKALGVVMDLPYTQLLPCELEANCLKPSFPKYITNEF